MNALKGELRGKWLEKLGIMEKAQEMWTNALMNSEVDEFEETVNNDDEIKFMFKGKNKEESKYLQYLAKQKDPKKRKAQICKKNDK